MRVVAFALCFLALPLGTLAAPTWQLITAESGRRIELDRTTIKREDGGKVTALGRVTLDKEIPDTRSGQNYRLIESLTRYDCTARNAATLKRVLKKSDDSIVREEEFPGTDMPVRTGTLDDKILREVCRPGGPKFEAEEVVQKANEAADKLRTANEALLKQTLAKESAKGAVAKAAVIRTQPRQAGSAKLVSRPAPVRDEPVARVDWGYEGAGAPENWARIDPANRLCATGRRQSPIDIRDGIRVDLEAIKFDYRPSRFHITDTGRTVEVLLGAHRFSLTGKTYELVKVQFHRPAEVKVGGKRYEMAAHLVHRAADGQQAIVVVLMERGSEHPLIQTLWNYLPLERGFTVMPPDVGVDLSALLPENRNYFTFMGSLSAPPCSEGVLWLVLKQPVQVSDEQIAIFSRLYSNNARPVQPLAGRLIKEGR